MKEGQRAEKAGLADNYEFFIRVYPPNPPFPRAIVGYYSS